MTEQGKAEFKAVILANELNLNEIAEHFGINRSYKWDDTLLLQDGCIEGLVRDPVNKKIYVFSFGSAVFINFPHHEIMDVIKYLKTIQANVIADQVFTYVDDYAVYIDDTQPAAISNDYMVAAQAESYQHEIVAVILAKSVALEKIEMDIDKLLDKTELVVDKLEAGKFQVSDEKLAEMSARILRFKFGTISYIMLLDEPDITWSLAEAGVLYGKLSRLFELKDRYEKVQHKTETLMNITEVFSGLVHAARGTRLEWIIIILIAFEIGLSLWEMFHR